MRHYRRYVVTRANVATGLLVVVAAFGIVYSMGTEVLPSQVIAEQGPPAAPSPSSVEITYIANEGVLIASGETQVLVDGLFREYSTYPFLPQPYQNQLETATAPFDAIDLVLVSHVHGDHFHPAPVARYLQSNRTTRLVSSEQVVNEVQTQADFAAVASRVTTVTPPVAQRVALTAAGVQVEVLGLGHGTRHQNIQNLGHIVTIGGKKLLHVGDADPSTGVFEALNLDEAGIDIAFLPVWFLTDAAAVVRDHIRPKHIIVVHMARGAGDREMPWLRAFPEAVPFVRLLEKRYY